MSRRANLIGICAVSSLCILLLIATQHRPIADISYTPETFNQTVTINDVVQLQRTRILQEMENFEYPSGRFGVDAEKLADMTPETGGTPVRSVIITTWRSGSTFLGDILNAMPGNYYHYEPLLNFDISQIRGPPNDKKAIGNLKKLLNCDYSDMDEYLEYGKTHQHLFHHNERLWRQCKEYPQFCWKSKFLTPFCKLFPLQSMKVVRLRLALAEQLLDDTSLNACDNLKVLLKLGGYIAAVNDTPYNEPTFVMKLFGFKRLNDPSNVLNPSMLPGHCYGFKGSYSSITIKLVAPIFIDSISIEHIMKHASPNGNIFSAPKDVSVYGLENINDEKNMFNFGTFTYNIFIGQPIQHFSFALTSPKRYQFVNFMFLSNHGHPNYTCVYSLNVRVLLLVRDPRGTMQSRKHRLWCPGNPDCDDASYLCNDLISDYYAAEILNKKYPSRFRAVRYEDLSISPYDMSQDVLQFYGLPFDPMVEEFLDTHTKLNIGGVSSTFRDSKSAPFHWIKDLMWYEIVEIEKNCGKAMDLWGYRKVNSSKELDAAFDPLLPAPFT